MAKLVGLLLVLGALAAAVLYVPLGGRTVRDRWQAARSPAEFVRRSYDELKVAAGVEDSPRKHPAVARAKPGAAAKRTPPVERHTDADRAALERIVADHAEK